MIIGACPKLKGKKKQLDLQHHTNKQRHQRHMLQVAHFSHKQTEHTEVVPSTGVALKL